VLGVYGTDYCFYRAMHNNVTVIRHILQWCHKSGYDGVTCAKAKAAKRYLWNRCAKRAVSSFDLLPACACFVRLDPAVGHLLLARLLYIYVAALLCLLVAA
jgi:hypothetical protein